MEPRLAENKGCQSTSNLSHILEAMVDDLDKKELSDYLSFLETSSGERSEQAEQQESVPTPRIDQVLQKRRRGETGQTGSSAYDTRLEVLEQRLGELQKKSEERLTELHDCGPQSVATTTATMTSPSCDDEPRRRGGSRSPDTTSPSTAEAGQARRRGRRGQPAGQWQGGRGRGRGEAGPGPGPGPGQRQGPRISAAPQQRTRTADRPQPGRPSSRPSEGFNRQHYASSSRKASARDQQQSVARGQQSVARGSRSDPPLYSSDSEVEVVAKGAWSTTFSTTPPAKTRLVQPLSRDLQLRSELERPPPSQPQPPAHPNASSSGTELSSLLKDLEAERERRWKAEQVAHKLVEHVRDLRGREADHSQHRDGLLLRLAELEQQCEQLGKDREHFSTENEALKKALGEVKRALGASREVCDNQQSALQALEASLRSLEAAAAEDRAGASQALRESEGRAHGLDREADMLKKTVRTLKGQLGQLRELLASREQQHKVELEGRVPLQGAELQEVVRKEVRRERQLSRQALQLLKDRLTEQEEKYRSLEEEFRTALRVEARRYKELLSRQGALQEEAESSRRAAVEVVQREQAVTHTVGRLTTVAKEQKQRIADLHRSKAHSEQELKAKLAELEVELSTKTKLESKLESAEQENSKLKSQVLAQTSVVEGLRGERQLWGKELAHQGATLAQDRGRMTSQIEALQSEAHTLQDKLKNEEDCRRIGEKVQADLRSTAAQLRQESAASRQAQQLAQQQWGEERTGLRDQLDRLATDNRDLESELASLHLRKEELKEALALAEHQHQTAADKYRGLKSSLEERSSAIAAVEQEMGRVQSSFQAREQGLLQERDQLQDQLRVLQDRFKACDDHFREQLASKEKSFQESLQRELGKKDLELEALMDKVTKTEHEMRTLLTEVALERKSTKEKMQRLSRAMGDLSHPSQT